MIAFFTWLFSLFKHKAATPAAPVVGPQTISPMDYLWQHLVTDTLEARRIDFGGFQISDSLKVDDTTAIATWSYTPFGPFVPSNGDGGEEYVVKGDTVYITYTRDGSTPADQQFANNDWLLFRNDVTSDWKETISGTNKFTRYCRQTILLPVIADVDCVVCEHYNGSTAAKSTAMERIFLGKGYGRLVWQAWNRPPVLVSNLSNRAIDFGWNSLDGWVLADTRICVNPFTTMPVLGSALWSPGK